MFNLRPEQFEDGGEDHKEESGYNAGGRHRKSLHPADVHMSSIRGNAFREQKTSTVIRNFQGLELSGGPAGGPSLSNSGGERGRFEVKQLLEASSRDGKGRAGSVGSRSTSTAANINNHGRGQGGTREGAPRNDNYSPRSDVGGGSTYEWGEVNGQKGGDDRPSNPRRVGSGNHDGTTGRGGSQGRRRANSASPRARDNPDPGKSGSKERGSHTRDNSGDSGQDGGDGYEREASDIPPPPRRKVAAVPKSSGVWERVYSASRQSFMLCDRSRSLSHWECEPVGSGFPDWEKHFSIDSETFFYHNVSTGELREDYNWPPMETPSNESQIVAGGSEEFRMMKTLRESESHDSVLEDAMYIKGKGHKVHRGVWSPSDPRRLAWDICVTIPLLMYIAIMMPFRLCFGVEAKAMGTMWLWELSIDFMFILDILLNFRTGYYETDSEGVEYIQTEPCKSANNYLRGWFTIDFFSGIPYDLLTVGVLSKVKGLKMLKGFRFFKFIKLLRFLKISKLIKNREVLDYIEDLQSDLKTRSTLRIIKIIVLTAFACHFMSCLWGLVGLSSAQSGDVGWFSFDDIELVEREDNAGEMGWVIPDDKVGHIYLASFYLCFTTITSVGYGDIFPINNSERMVAVFIEAGGGLVYAMIIASVTSIVTSMDANTRLVQEELDSISSYCRIANFPKKLGKRVRRYFRHYYATKSAIDQGAILTQLSRSLRSEVAEFMLADMLGSVDIFRSVSSTDNSEMWAAILPLLRPIKFEDDEILCEQGEDTQDMMIVIEGKVKCIAKLEDSEMAVLSQHRSQEVPNTGRETRIVSTGDCINDVNMLRIWDHAIESARALCPTDVYVLTHLDFHRTFGEKKHEEMKKEMEYYAKSRYDTIPTENSSWGRPVRVKSTARVEEWRKANPLDVSDSEQARKTQAAKLLRRTSMASPERGGSEERKKKTKKRTKSKSQEH